MRKLVPLAIATVVLLSSCSTSAFQSGDGSTPSSSSTPATTGAAGSTSPTSGVTSDGVGGSDTTGTLPELDSPDAGALVVVSDLQLDLQSLGYSPGSANGQFDSATKAALIKFQRKSGVASAEIGALGPSTGTALSKALGGSTDTVSALQSALTDMGSYHDVIDGQYGTTTIAAVKSIQAEAGLSIDGYYGPQTAAALASIYTQVVAEPPEKAPSPETGSEVLTLGTTGAAVTILQQRLTSLGYRPGPADGTYGAATAGAVLAFQKREGLQRDGVAGPSVMAALAHPTGAGPQQSGPGPLVEVDIARQIAFVILPGRPVITLNVSTGNGETYSVLGGGKDVAYTPVGTFAVLRKISGDEKAPLGTLHDPMYFYQGWAIHGSSSVPAYPASHGCVRISNTDADWLFPLIPVGTKVVLYDTTGRSPSVGSAPAGAAPGF